MIPGRIIATEDTEIKEKRNILDPDVKPGQAGLTGLTR